MKLSIHDIHISVFNFGSNIMKKFFCMLISHCGTSVASSV